MRKAKLLVTLAIVSLVVHPPTRAAGDQPSEALAARRELSRISALADAGAIERIELFHLDNRLVTGVPISPERLKEIYGYKLEIVARRLSMKKLSQVLSRTTTASLPGNAIDTRTVVLFYTMDKKTIEISLTGPGVWAIVNGHAAVTCPQFPHGDLTT